jgi:hypothetical protein
MPSLSFTWVQDQRAMALARLATAKKSLATLQAELEAYGACDPVKVEEKRRAVMLAREAALRHTGHPIFSLRTLCGAVIRKAD